MIPQRNFTRFFYLCAVTLGCFLGLLEQRSLVAADLVRVMSFNIWVGGEAGKQPLSQTAEVIKAGRADIVGMQETHGNEKDGKQPDNGRKISEILGWNYFDQGERTGILTRFLIITNTPRKWGVLVRLPSGKEAWMFNAHLYHAPYQPYQLLGIPYANGRFIKTAAEAVSEAQKARGAQVERLLTELKPALVSGKPVFLTGDFNEPSHLDWTERAADAGKVPIAVRFPSTLAVAEAGMHDTFRLLFPDEVQNRGNTWTPTTSPDDPKDRHDRIDFVFIGMTRGERFPIVPDWGMNNFKIIGEDAKFADIIVKPYPSDHRAVVATIGLH